MREMAGGVNVMSVGFSFLIHSALAHILLQDPV